MDLSNVFVTEGVPYLTYVKPPNYNEILLDMKKVGKPVVIEGQAGTGKTSTVLKIIDDLKDKVIFKYLSARKRDDLLEILKLSNDPKKGNYVIDDFHRLPDIIKKNLSNIAKVSADEGHDSNYPKLVIIGINQTGTELLTLSPDIAKRCGIHKIKPGSEKAIMEIIEKGEFLLNIKFLRPKIIFTESKGDYWLAQILCQTFCLKSDIVERQEESQLITAKISEVRKSIIDRLENSFNPIVKEFCRGKRFRPSNNSYFKFLQLTSQCDDYPIDLNELIGTAENSDKNAVNSIKDHRLEIHIKDKPLLSTNFYYSKETKLFNIEDPALQYYIKHIDWKKLYKECGFTSTNNNYVFDVAISFAGENRKLAEKITFFLKILDYEVFYDELYEANYIGSSWSKEFERIFTTDSKYVICLLDNFHKNKIWPTFERECFAEKVPLKQLIPVFLDDTKFVGIPQDLIGIKFKYEQEEINEKVEDLIFREIILKIVKKID